MNAAGIVVEYNPFHNGHAFHLDSTKKMTHADIIVAVMSGQFLQRGEPALLPKWYRAEMALKAGADIVIELPYQFSTQKADTFAFGGVSILASMGCQSLCFGSESGNIELFQATLTFLEEHKEVFERTIKNYMVEGVSYPAAISAAYTKLRPSDAVLDLSRPNNILGIEYIRAIKKLRAPINAITIERSSADYHDETFSSESIASATSIRKKIFSAEEGLDEIKPYVPFSTYVLLKQYAKNYGTFHSWENYWPYLRFRLMHSTPEELAEIYEVEEGLENRLIRVALSANSFHDFMSQVKTKRYTWTRLQRICLHILTNTKKNEMKTRMEKVSYMRLLGMTEKGRKYLNSRKAHLPIPLISKISSYKADNIALDIRASRVYAMGAKKNFQQELIEMDHIKPPIYIGDES